MKEMDFLQMLGFKTLTEWRIMTDWGRLKFEPIDDRYISIKAVWDFFYGEKRGYVTPEAMADFLAKNSKPDEITSLRARAEKAEADMVGLERGAMEEVKKWRDRVEKAQAELAHMRQGREEAEESLGAYQAERNEYGNLAENAEYISVLKSHIDMLKIDTPQTRSPEPDQESTNKSTA